MTIIQDRKFYTEFIYHISGNIKKIFCPEPLPAPSRPRMRFGHLSMVKSGENLTTRLEVIDLLLVFNMGFNRKSKLKQKLRNRKSEKENQKK